MGFALPAVVTRVLAAAAAAVCLGGCADVAVRDEAGYWARRGPEGRPLRELWLGRAWAGRTRDELEREWGAPSFVIEMPMFGGGPSSKVIVFVGRDRAGGCIDAFVLLKDDAQTISTYVCR